MRPVDELRPGQKLLVRLDLNTSVEDGEPLENHRFRRHAETLMMLLEDHAAAIMTHQGRPGRNDFISTEKHAEILEELTGLKIEHVKQVHGEKARGKIRGLGIGDALLLENTRMSGSELPEKPADKHAESEMVQQLTPFFDAYVNDAYPAAHRSHASLVGFTETLPSYAGPVMENEHRSIQKVKKKAENSDRVTALLGGNKPEDVFNVIKGLSSVDRFLVAGVPAQAMLHHEKGLKTDLPEETLEKAAETLEENREKIVLPVDLAKQASGRKEIKVAEAEDCRFKDIGSETVQQFKQEMQGSDAVLVKGSPGVFEEEEFQKGTRELLEHIKGLNGFTLVGGGTTGKAAEQLGIGKEGFNHVSISGGAYLRALTGEELAAVKALRKNKVSIDRRA